MNEENPPVPDLRNKIMGEIREKKVKIACPATAWLKKALAESAIVLFVLWGGFFASGFLYFLENTRLFKFLSFGVPGLKTFLAEIPYGYLALFFLAIILAAYLAEKSDFCYQEKISSEKIIPLFFLGSLLAGVAFLFLGANDFFEIFPKKNAPMESAAWGRVLEVGPEEILIQEEGGRVVRIRSEKYKNPMEAWPNSQGKFLRAVGERQNGNADIFKAEFVFCCDED